MIFRVSPALIWCEFSATTPDSAFFSGQQRAIHTPSPNFSPKMRCAIARCSGKVNSIDCCVSLHFSRISSSDSRKLRLTTAHRFTPIMCSGTSLIFQCHVKGLSLSTVSFTTCLLLFDRVFMATCTLFLIVNNSRKIIEG